VFFGAATLTEEKLRELDAKGWELYNVAEDPAETNFTGTIFKVTVDVAGKMTQDTAEEKKAHAKAAMATQ
jgi:hypothetical protein